MNQPMNKKLLEHLRKVLKEKKEFPIGIIAYFGPDKESITKMAALVVPGSDIKPVLKSWSQLDVTSDPKVVSEIGQFFLENETQNIVIDTVIPI